MPDISMDDDQEFVVSTEEPVLNPTHICSELLQDSSSMADLVRIHVRDLRRAMSMPSPRRAHISCSALTSEQSYYNATQRAD